MGRGTLRGGGGVRDVLASFPFTASGSPRTDALYNLDMVESSGSSASVSTGEEGSSVGAGGGGAGRRFFTLQYSRFIVTLGSCRFRWKQLKWQTTRIYNMNKLEYNNVVM
jgi:hypothetical protein